MVIKKPYAFLIKHFRAVHLFLLVPMIYLLLKTRDIIAFFTNYIKNDYSINFVTNLGSLSSNYINIFMYLAIIIIVVVFIAISLMFQKKEKPTKFYNMSILYYFAIFIIMTTCFSVFESISNNTMSSLGIRLIRDIGYVVHSSQYIIIFLTFVRATGFDIKKFDFRSDIEDLEIDSEDSEEFEFLVGNNSYKTKRTIRRFISEVIYWYKENKFIFTVIFVVIAGSVITYAYVNRTVAQPKYRENQIISYGNSNVTVNSSYISNLSSSGEVINENKTYVIVEATIENRFLENKNFNSNNFQLYINKKFFSPNLVAANYFTDFGNPYNGGPIKGSSKNNYIFVYEIDKKLATKKMAIKALSSYDSSPGGIGAINKTINLNPKEVSSKIVTNNVGMGINIDLKATNFKNSKVSINSFELTNNYSYTYKYCVQENECYDASKNVNITGSDIGRYTYLVLDYKLELDEKAPYVPGRTYKSFFEDFLKIKYYANNREVSQGVSLANPANYHDKLIIKVPINITSSDTIVASLNIRNKTYNIKLK